MMLKTGSAQGGRLNGSLGTVVPRSRRHWPSLPGLLATWVLLGFLGGY
jgi:hypothetical protein